MTTTSDHEHPQYVTYAHLEALEGRLINRMAQVELDLTRDVNTAFWRIVGLVLPIYALVIGAIVAVVLFGLNIISRLPSAPSP
jgi:hypothetical protein